MATGIHQVGADAVKALRALRSAKASKDRSVKKFRDLIEERNAAARPLLIQVRDYLATGRPVNGQLTWDKWADQVAGFSKRQLNNIITPRPSRGGNPGSRSVVLKDGMTVKIGNRTFSIESAPQEDELHKTKLGGFRVSMLLKPVVEEPKSAIHAADPNSGGTHTRCGQEKTAGVLWVPDANASCPKCIAALKEEEAPKPVTHIRASARKSLCQSFYINRPRKGTVLAGWDEEITCPDCLKIRDEAEARIAQRSAAVELAETLDSLPPTPVNDCRDYSMEDVKALFEETN